MYGRPIKWMLISVIWLLELNGLEVQASTAFEDGMRDFQLNRYHAAEAEFEQAIVNQSKSDLALLMLGKTREQLKDRQGAQEAYEAAFSINPFSKSGLLAKQALLDLAARTEEKKHHAFDDVFDNPAIVRSSIDTIQSQARLLGKIHIRQANASATTRLQLTLDSDAADYKHNGSRAYLTLGLTPIYQREISDSEVIRQNRRSFDDQAQASLYRAYGLTKATYAQDAANNLSNLLVDHGYSQEPRMRALGTNLYVRNYDVSSKDDLPPEDPLIELKATPLSLTNVDQTTHKQTRSVQKAHICNRISNRVLN